MTDKFIAAFSLPLSLSLPQCTVRTVQYVQYSDLKEGILMSERLYVDPQVNGVREERALFLFAKNLGLTYGSYFRLGVLHYSRSLAEGGFLPQHLKSDYEAISTKDQDYLKLLLEERQAADAEQLRLATDMELPKLTPNLPNWGCLPPDQALSEYIRHLFKPEEREVWILQHIESSDPFSVEAAFLSDFIIRHKSCENKPDILLEATEIRKVLRGWAESRRGF